MFELLNSPRMLDATLMGKNSLRIRCGLLLFGSLETSAARIAERLVNVVFVGPALPMVFRHQKVVVAPMVLSRCSGSSPNAP
jgi:hypothetical protein